MTHIFKGYDLERLTCAKCKEPNALWFAFEDETYACECGHEGPLSELVPKVQP